MKPTPISATGVKTEPLVWAVCCIAFLTIVLAVAFLATSRAFAKPAPQDGSQNRGAATSQPVELGDVQWQRDLDKAVSDSKQQDKPIAILFQEVPG